MKREKFFSSKLMNNAAWTIDLNLLHKFPLDCLGMPSSSLCSLYPEKNERIILLRKELNLSGGAGGCSANERGVILITFLSIKTFSIFLIFYMACNECELELRKSLRMFMRWHQRWRGREMLVENKNNDDDDEDWNALRE